MLTKNLFTFGVATIALGAFAATPTITGVTAQQRYPWNGKVDISYTVTSDIAAEAKQRAAFASLKVTAIDKVANTTKVATQLSGDTALAVGTHKFVWDMNAEGQDLAKVAIMATENIHVNSFMYESLIDTGIKPLADLYVRVSKWKVPAEEKIPSCDFL